MQHNNFNIALATDITQPLLNKLANRLQAQNQAANNADKPAKTVLLDELLSHEIADASVLVAITNEDNPQLLLTVRASHINAHAGEVAFAGGKYEPEDGNNVTTALRETHEETNLHPNNVEVIGALPIQTSKAGLAVCPVVAIIEPNQALVPEEGEIARIFWADFATLIEQPTTEYKVDVNFKGHDIKIATPCWQVDGETVWGLTGRIIASMLDIGFDRQIEWYYHPA